jgi:solute carrier family 25 (mitochondrial phosphate transporter), member 23/24/25/41
MFKRAAVYATGGEPGSQPHLVARMISGSAAGLMAQTIMFPFDTVRKRMQVQGIGGAPRVYANSFEAVRGILGAEGVRGFFKGAGTNAVRAVPEAAIQFALYDFTRDLFLAWGGTGGSTAQKR